MKNTHIQWCNHTWNTHMFCRKVSEGCKNCYMFRDLDKLNIDIEKVTKTRNPTFNYPLMEENPSIFFANSWSDFFIEEADEWRNEAWEVIRKTPNHIYLLLTKREDRMEKCLPPDWGGGYDNVWLGVSVENQKNTSRINVLKEIPSKIKFVSFEPLIGEIRLDKGQVESIDWAIIGGESGNEIGKHSYRACEIEWFEKLIDQFKMTKTAIFVKQLGTHLANQFYLMDDKGGDWDEWGAFPELKIREHPIDVSMYFKEN